MGDNDEIARLVHSFVHFRAIETGMLPRRLWAQVQLIREPGSGPDSPHLQIALKNILKKMLAISSHLVED